jgi:hypothetical protein
MKIYEHATGLQSLMPQHSKYLRNIAVCCMPSNARPLLAALEKLQCFLSQLVEYCRVSSYPDCVETTGTTYLL